MGQQNNSETCQTQLALRQFFGNILWLKIGQEVTYYKVCVLGVKFLNIGPIVILDGSPEQVALVNRGFTRAVRVEEFLNLARLFFYKYLSHSFQTKV